MIGSHAFPRDRGGFGPRPIRRDLDPELGALTFDAVKADGSVHELGQALGDGQADARTFDGPGLLACTMKRLEHLVLLVLRDTHPVVGDGETDNAVLRHGSKGRGPTLAPILDRVGAEVHQDLLEARAIGDHLRTIGRNRLDDELDLGARCHRVERGLHLGQHLGDADGLRGDGDATCLDVRQVEHFVDQAQEVLPALHD
jgi:hypothetical protein